MTKQPENLITINVILQNDVRYTKLETIQLAYLPSKGDLFALEAPMKIYRIKQILHDGNQVTLIVCETKPELQNILEILYK